MFQAVLSVSSLIPLSFFFLNPQELDYGALYELRTPHFYVEANKMPTARVRSPD